MRQVAIRVEGISKRYRIGRRQERYRTLSDTLADSVAAPFHRAYRRLRGSADHSSSAHDSIWALEDVSLEIRSGEVVGLIGRNGAGKTTFLKVLARITEPTRGFAEIRGRVGSLLEVGTGFHPELTGRENIYLNGAILGMKRAEITRKFDDIVAFAEVEKFIDTPVKHYSTGMHLRLGFAVAAHLEPEILLVDEVLAVGDAKFQKKCLAKMQNVGEQGRTVLFVSHSTPAITRLCERVILLDEGRVLADGPAHRVVAAYLNSGGTMAEREWPDPLEAPGDHIVHLRAVRVKTEDGRITETVDIRRPVGIEIEYDVLTPGNVLSPHYSVHNEQGVYLFTAIDQDPEWRRRPRPIGRYVSTGWIPGNFLAEGMMVVGPAMRTVEPHTLHFYVPEAVAFQVIDSLDGDTARGDHRRNIPGVVRPLLRWTTHSVPGGPPAPDA